MKCSKCKADNPNDKKFCSQCGAKLLCLCQQCGCEVLITDKFCGECGQTLDGTAQTEKKEQTFEEKLSAIQKYLPGGLTEKILAQKGRIEGERRQVTVLFADMENFTPLVERLGSEEAYALMDQVYEILIHKVHEFEGTVNEMTGDGIMALFGAPIALEDAPQRAIRSALAIHQEIARFSDHLQQQKDIPPIRMRIGIHTGPVVVGTLGNDLRVEFKAVGDTVNLAARLQQAAPACETWVSGETSQLVEGFFNFEPVGGKAFKGNAKQVQVFQVAESSLIRSRFDARAERGLTPMAGRARELELMADGFFDRVVNGRGQSFSIVGEAGVGKSRLIHEFKRSLKTNDIQTLEGQCLSFGGSSPYHPFLDLLRSVFSIQDNETKEQSKERISSVICKLQLNNSEFTEPLLQQLFSIKTDRFDQFSMSPESRKERIIESIKLIFLKISEDRPLIIFIEDLHWIDKSSEEALKYLLEAISGAKIMVVLTFRPEYSPNWANRSYHNQLNLNRLSNRECLSIITHLLGPGTMAPEVKKLVLDKTEGIPFFIEEFISTSIDLKLIEKKNDMIQLSGEKNTFAIPSTIQDIIMARVDLLPEPTRKVLQAASVIEREFTFDLIQKIADLSEQELSTHLSILKNHELVYERGVRPDVHFMFRHALTRDVVYGSILERKRKQLHEQVGSFMEDLYKGNLEAHAGFLAEHFYLCENFSKASEYLRLAEKVAVKKAAFPDAIFYSKKRVVCAERIPGVDPEKIIDARTSYSLNLSQLNHIYEAGRAVLPIIDLGNYSA
jgi:class 3 adenylate cyclase/DNA-binding transcriptional ArsR family regulator